MRGPLGVFQDALKIIVTLYFWFIVLLYIWNIRGSKEKKLRTLASRVVRKSSQQVRIILFENERCHLKTDIQFFRTTSSFLQLSYLCTQK